MRESPPSFRKKEVRSDKSGEQKRRKAFPWIAQGSSRCAIRFYCHLVPCLRLVVEHGTDALFEELLVGCHWLIAYVLAALLVRALLAARRATSGGRAVQVPPRVRREPTAGPRLHPPCVCGRLGTCATASRLHPPRTRPLRATDLRDDTPLARQHPRRPSVRYAHAVLIFRHLLYLYSRPCLLQCLRARPPLLPRTVCGIHLFVRRGFVQHPPSRTSSTTLGDKLLHPTAVLHRRF